MVRHAKDRKRRSGRSTTKLKNRSWVRWDPNPKIKNPVVKENWDASKSPAENLSSMGLLARPNQLPSENDQGGVGGTTGNRINANSKVTKAHVIELFDVPDSDRPNRVTRFPLTRDDEEYMARCMAKHGDNYKAMFRDIKTNNMQHTEDRLRKLGARFLLLSPEQRQVPVPDKVKELLS